MKKCKANAEQVDALLPQTQCGLCTYGGCMPYAKAMVEDNAAINLCPPGGVPTLRELGKLLQQDSDPYVNEMEQKAKPTMLAMIREDECIGCTKCIQACPVDAIVGAPKLMHTVIARDCTGCELCIAPCPVDCIDMLIVSENNALTFDDRQQKSSHARKLFEAKEKRKLAHTTEKSQLKIQDKKSLIEAALLRAKAKNV